MTEIDETDSMQVIPVPATGLGLASIALFLPVISGILLCFVNSVLFSLSISVMMVVATSALLAIDATLLGTRDLQGRERESPGILFVGMLAIWIVAYPYAFFRRGGFATPNLGFLALLVAIFSVFAPLVVATLRASSLPACDSPEVTRLVEQLIRRSSSGAAAKSIDGHRELNHDRAAGVRYGECVAHSESGDVSVKYLVEWQDRQARRFQVRLAEPELPACTSHEVVSTLERVVRHSLVNATAKTIDGHREVSYDRAADVRRGECVAHLESGDMPVKFTVEWQDRKAGRFQVRLDKSEVPACTSAEVVKTLEEVIRSTPLGAAAKSIDGHREVSYDREADVRHGECVAHLDSGDVTIKFIVEWQKESAGRFFVRLAHELPECTSPEVVRVLAEGFRTTPAGAKVKSIDGHRELNYDRAADVRHGECVAHLDAGDLLVRFVVEWQDREAGLFRVRFIASQEENSADL